jgi:hypothetical protein
MGTAGGGRVSLLASRAPLTPFDGRVYNERAAGGLVRHGGGA